MARFFVNVNRVVSVEVDDSFLSEHRGNHDAIADEIADLVMCGHSQLVDESVVDAVEELPSGNLSDSPIPFA